MVKENQADLFRAGLFFCASYILCNRHENIPVLFYFTIVGIIVLSLLCQIRAKTVPSYS